jgi:hypothetical protein
MLSNDPIRPVKRINNELDPRLLSMNALNSFTMHDSKSREMMFSAHLSQFLVVNGASKKRIQSGVEAEFSKTTFKYQFPCNATIIRVIEKYPRSVGVSDIRENPMSLIVYENEETKEVGIIEAATYSTYIDKKHMHYGFKYNFTPLCDQLSPGMRVEAGSVIGDSPAVVSEQGAVDYCYGVETNVAFMGIPQVVEDGLVVSESYLKKITSTGIEKRVAFWGKTHYPLNLYATNDQEYKPFPDIGDTIRPDGLLFALRRYDELLSPVEMTPRALRTPDAIFDKRIHGIAGAKVIDITVHRGGNPAKLPLTPIGMTGQVEKYHSALTQYYTRILEEYRALYQQRRKAVKLTPEFHRLIVEAMNYVGPEQTQQITRSWSRRLNQIPNRHVKQLYAGEDIDDWRVEITFEYPVVPNIGFKQSDTHGGSINI